MLEGDWCLIKTDSIRRLFGLLVEFHGWKGRKCAGVSTAARCRVDETAAGSGSAGTDAGNIWIMPTGQLFGVHFMSVKGME